MNNKNMQNINKMNKKLAHKRARRNNRIVAVEETIMYHFYEEWEEWGRNVFH